MKLTEAVQSKVRGKADSSTVVTQELKSRTVKGKAEFKISIKLREALIEIQILTQWNSQQEKSMTETQKLLTPSPQHQSQGSLSSNKRYKTTFLSKMRKSN